MVEKSSEAQPRYLDETLGTVAGPRWNNFDVCPAADYVCTFACSERVSSGKFVETTCDLYITEGVFGQSYLIRPSEEWEGAYYSGPLFTLFRCPSEQSKQALHILTCMGEFRWAARPPKGGKAP